MKNPSRLSILAPSSSLSAHGATRVHRSGQSSRRDRLIRSLFAGLSGVTLWAVASLLILAPLPKASAYPRALTFIEVLVFALIIVWQFNVALAPIALGQPKRRLLLLVLLFDLTILLQLTPLPPSVIRILTRHLPSL